MPTENNSEYIIDQGSSNILGLMEVHEQLDISLDTKGSSPKGMCSMAMHLFLVRMVLKNSNNKIQITSESFRNFIRILQSEFNSEPRIVFQNSSEYFLIPYVNSRP